MKSKLGRKSIEFLKNFIDKNESIIDYILNPRQYIRESIGGTPHYVFYSLKKGKYLSQKNKKYYLTKKGKQEVHKIILTNKIKNNKWDRKWRILIFDIPEAKKKFRDNLRKILISIGFRQLQKSVWVFPYDILNFLYDIIPGFREGDWFEYVEADRISSEKEMKEWFGLK